MDQQKLTQLMKPSEFLKEINKILIQLNNKIDNLEMKTTIAINQLRKELESKN